MNLSTYQATVMRVCFDAEAQPKDLDALGHGERWKTYRRMVRARLERVLRTALPRSVERLGEDFLALFSDWLSQRGPRSPLFRALPLEFQEFAEDRLDAFAQDLARYEALSWSLRDAPSDMPEAAPIDFEQALALNPAIARLSTANLVHRRLEDEAKAIAQRRHLILYRNADHRVVTLVVNGLTFDLMGAWLAPHVSLAQSIREVAERRGEVMGERFMESLGALLADYIERGVILGAKRATL